MASLLLSGCLWTGWLACFASFGWATRRHFLNRGAYTAGMRWTIALGTLFSLLQAGAIASGLGSTAAACVYAAAFALFWWTIRTTSGKGFGACYESIESKELVTYGPYRWVRHPFYASYMLAWIAGAFLHPALLVAPVTMYFLYRRAAIAEEERFLTGGAHASAYSDYLRHTGRFLISFSGIRRRRRGNEKLR